MFAEFKLPCAVFFRFIPLYLARAAVHFATLRPLLVIGFTKSTLFSISCRIIAGYERPFQHIGTVQLYDSVERFGTAVLEYDKKSDFIEVQW